MKPPAGPPASGHPPGRWGDGRRRRIGLLGGSFNPAHAGHRHVAEQAIRRLRLHQVWLLVSPGNPLKPAAGMAPFASRLASAQRIADRRRVLATDLEARLGTRFTIATLDRLRRHFRRSRFVLLMGADNLTQLPRWRDWRRLARSTPMAVLPRPGETAPALHGQAAHTLARHRRPATALLNPPAARGSHAGWALVAAREHPASATAIRHAAVPAGLGV